MPSNATLSRRLVGVVVAVIVYAGISLAVGESVGHVLKGSLFVGVGVGIALAVVEGRRHFASRAAKPS